MWRLVLVDDDGLDLLRRSFLFATSPLCPSVTKEEVITSKSDRGGWPSSTVPTLPWLSQRRGRRGLSVSSYILPPKSQLSVVELLTVSINLDNKGSIEYTRVLFKGKPCPVGDGSLDCGAHVTHQTSPHKWPFPRKSIVLCESDRRRITLYRPLRKGVTPPTFGSFFLSLP